jgi:hypothetical protein
MVATDVASRGIGMISNSLRDFLLFLARNQSPFLSFLSSCVIRFMLCFLKLVRSTCRCYYNLVQGLHKSADSPVNLGCSQMEYAHLMSAVIAPTNC